MSTLSTCVLGLFSAACPANHCYYYFWCFFLFLVLSKKIDRYNYEFWWILLLLSLVTSFNGLSFQCLWKLINNFQNILHFSGHPYNVSVSVHTDVCVCVSALYFMWLKSPERLTVDGWYVQQRTLFCVDMDMVIFDS